MLGRWSSAGAFCCPSASVSERNVEVGAQPAPLCAALQGSRYVGGGDQERTDPQGSVRLLLGHVQGAQPDGNTTGTSLTLRMTQLPVQGEVGWFLLGLKMPGMVCPCCPEAMQGGPESQMASRWSASCQGGGRRL